MGKPTGGGGHRCRTAALCTTVQTPAGRHDTASRVGKTVVNSKRLVNRSVAMPYALQYAAGVVLTLFLIAQGRVENRA